MVATQKVDEDYLSPDYDATKLTKPQLRSILAEHGVTDLPPASARKEALIELFAQHVQSRAAQIRRQRAGVRASDKGISFLDKDSQPSPKKSPSPRGRSKSPPKRAGSPTRAKSATSPLRGRRHVSPSSSPAKGDKRISSPSRSPSTRQRGRAKQTRKGLKEEDDKDNVFKEGTPKQRKKTQRSVSRKKTTSRTTATRSPSPTRTPSRGRTASIPKESPIAALQRSVPRYSDSPQSATLKLHDRLEFIAEANRLNKAQSAMNEQPRQHRSPSRSHPQQQQHHHHHHRRTKTNSLDLLRSLARVMLALLRTLFFVLTVVSIGLYIRWKFFYPFSYCDSGVNLERFLHPHWNWREIPRMINEFCIRCPLHGTCRHGQLQCQEGYLMVRNWLALGHDCVPDKRRLSLIDDLIGKIRHLLAERAGLAICGRIEELGRVLTEAQLAQELQTANPLAEWNGDQFGPLFKIALQEIGRSPTLLGIQVSQNPIDGMLMLQSLNPSVTIGCRLRLALYNIYRRNRIKIILSLCLCLFFLVVFVQRGRNRKTSRKVEELCQAVLQILAEQDALHRRDPTIPASLSIHQIRDALFFKSPARTRNRLWPLVCASISRNANVREMVMNLRGDQHRVWEWIGSDVLSPFLIPK